MCEAVKCFSASPAIRGGAERSEAEGAIKYPVSKSMCESRTGGKGRYLSDASSWGKQQA